MSLNRESIEKQLGESGANRGAVELLGISVVKNESDIIESFVRYNLNYVDMLLVIDNGSADATDEILTRLRAEGLPVVWISDDAPGHYQSRRLGALARAAAAFVSPRYLFPLDADEFIAAESRDHLLSALRSLPGDRVGRATWKTYVPTPDDDARIANPLTRITHCRQGELQWYSKVVAPAHLFSDPSVSLREGNHGLSRGDCDIEDVVLGDVRLAHFPIRSEKQLISKMLVGWLGMQLNAGRENGGAFHWREIFDRLKRTWAFSTLDLQHIGSIYSAREEHDLVREPLALPPGFATRYDSLVSVDPWRNLLAFLEDLSCEHPAFTKHAALLRDRLQTSSEDVRGSRGWRDFMDMFVHEVEVLLTSRPEVGQYA